jgi:hypothetical protein
MEEQTLLAFLVYDIFVLITPQRKAKTGKSLPYALETRNHDLTNWELLKGCKGCSIFVVVIYMNAEWLMYCM